MTVAVFKTPPAVKNSEVQFDEVKEDDLMCFTYWAKVTKKGYDKFGKEIIGVKNVDTDDEFIVQGAALIEDSKSADQYSETKTLPRRDVIDVLIHAKRVPFTVKFKKKGGQSRVLRGRLIGVREVNQGYVDVEDLEKDSDENRFRQVDTRTLEYVIVNGIKHVVR